MRRNRLIYALLLGCAAAVSTPLPAQTAPDTGHTSALAASLTGAEQVRSLTVTSPGFTAGANIPRDSTLYGANRFPGLDWTAGPAGTRSYLVIVQSALGGNSGRSSVHLTMFNLPASLRSLPAGMAQPPQGARFGPNVHGLDVPYSGPHTHTTTSQSYYYQVLALGRRLPDTAGQTFDQIMTAARGHVLAAGSIAGLSARPADAPADPAPAAAAPEAPPPPNVFVSASLISRADALMIAQRSIEACERQGEKAAAFVTDANGHLRAALTSDGMNEVGLRSVGRKTATVMNFKTSTHALRDRAAADPAFAAQYSKDERYYFSPGGMAIYRGDHFVAVLAVGGGHAVDESCALEALALLPWARTTPTSSGAQ
jgi:uncharacterized protein GlcG (DUF336 family)/phosphatidylethanolamine-binding protein (PEBP) family uncharacterized protein